MLRALARLLPPQLDNNYHGSKVALHLFLVLALAGIARSCIHLLAPDGGAGSIAGMDLTVAGADGIIFAFGLWGSAQLLMGVIQLVVYIRYRALVPFMYLLVAAEMALRILVGVLDPVTFAHTPPGAIANYLLLPIAIIMCWLSLWGKVPPAGTVE